MPLTDLPRAELAAYRPELVEPDDFDAFWSRTLAEARAHPLDPTFISVPSHLRHIAVHDVEFAGWAGERVRGWLALPRDPDGPLPCVVEFTGYGTGRGLPHQWTVFPAAGYAHFVLDNRGQSGHQPGDTPDSEAGSTGPQYPGFLTRGIGSPDSYYYRRLYTDVVRSIEAARAFAGIDPHRIAVVGGSQGGGLALVAGGLVPDLSAVVAHAPFLCHFPRAVEVASDPPYTELVGYLRANGHRADQAFATLRYFDALSFAARATARTLITVALMDPVCPPSTVYAAHHHCRADKELIVWPWSGHEAGGPSHQPLATLEFLHHTLPRTAGERGDCR